MGERRQIESDERFRPQQRQAPRPLGEQTPAGTEVTGAVSPAVEGATTPAPDAPETISAERAADREPAAKHTE